MSYKKKINNEENATKEIIKVSLSSLVKNAVKSCKERANDTTELVSKELVEAIIIHCEHNFKLKGQHKVLEELQSILLKLSLRMTESIACFYLLDVLMQRLSLFAAIINSNFRQMVASWEKSGLLGQGNECKQVREYIVQMTELWSITYCDHLREFASMHRYLREGLSIHAPSVDDKLRQVIEQKQNEEKTENHEYFTSLDHLLRVLLPETINEARSNLDRLQESFDQLFSDIHTNNHSQHANNIVPLSREETMEDQIKWDEIEWEQDDDIIDVESSSVAPAISGDMRLIIDPLQAITHPDKDEILQAISTITSKLICLYSVMNKYRQRIDDFILQHQSKSATSSATKRKHAPIGYDISVMLEIAESNRTELKSVVRLIKRALQEQCRSLLRKKPR